MPPVVIDLTKAVDPRDVVHRVVAALADGKLVAMPTETVYGVAASALSTEAVNRLLDAKNRDGKPLTLAIKSADDALDYVPDMSPLAQRLARRCWPGPLTMVLPESHDDSVITRLPKEVQSVIKLDGKVGLRVPGHGLTLQTLRLSAGPLVLSSANISGRPAATTAEDVVEQLGDSIDLVLDDGPSRFGQSSTVIDVGPSDFQILREGVISEATLQQLTFFLAVVVCTGNTCRSPMGEAILEKLLAEKIGCTVSELAAKGLAVKSAGIAAMPDGLPSLQSVEVMREMGIDITNHASQPFTNQFARNADMILTMTRGHRDAIVSQWPELAPRTFLFSNTERDISDPIGQAQSVYADCGNQLLGYAPHWVEQILNQAFPKESS